MRSLSDGCNIHASTCMSTSQLSFCSQLLYLQRCDLILTHATSAPTELQHIVVICCRLNTQVCKQRYAAERYQQLMSAPQERMGMLQELDSVAPAYTALCEWLRKHEWGATPYEKAYKHEIMTAAERC